MTPTRLALVLALLGLAEVEAIPTVRAPARTTLTLTHW